MTMQVGDVVTGVEAESLPLGSAVIIVHHEFSTMDRPVMRPWGAQVKVGDRRWVGPPSMLDELSPVSGYQVLYVNAWRAGRP
jgi:hypothetical protein